jgi:hypothetical protein
MASVTKVFPLRLEEMLYEKVRAVSEEDRRSMNSWVVIAIEKEVSRYNNLNAKQPLDYETK